MVVNCMYISYVEYNFQGCVYDTNIFTVLQACADCTIYNLSLVRAGPKHTEREYLYG